MQKQTRGWGAALGLALLAGCASVNPVASTEAAAGLARAEEAFAALSRAQGMKAAFLANLAPDAILLRPGPVNGPQAVQARPDPPINLDWRPQRVQVATSGELGYSTGPWKLTAKLNPMEPPSYGQFFTIWRKNAAGVWQVWFDEGISHPMPDGWAQALELLPNPTGPKPTQTLLQAQAGFEAMAQQQGTAAAYAAWSAPNLRRLIEEVPPQAGAGEAVTPEKVLVSGVAASGDWGWTLAAWRAPANGYTVRVWHADSGAWKLVMELRKDGPPPAPKPATGS
jgi:ketosteroid isomerase-like protein